jgi:hypothetical protein
MEQYVKRAVSGDGNKLIMMGLFYNVLVKQVGGIGEFVARVTDDRVGEWWGRRLEDGNYKRKGGNGIGLCKEYGCVVVKNASPSLFLARD